MLGTRSGGSGTRVSPRLFKQYENTDDVALHDIAAQLCSAITAGHRRVADADGSDEARERFAAQRHELAQLLGSLRVGDRRGTIRLIETWTEEAERFSAVSSR